MGQFEKDKNTKAIKLVMKDEQSRDVKNAADWQACDANGVRVNPKGYLLDKTGNIVNKRGDVIWRSHELMYNEPPKIFKFTQFSKLWIQGYLDRDVTLNQAHDD